MDIKERIRKIILINKIENNKDYADSINIKGKLKNIKGA